MSKISELSDGGSLQSTDYLIAVRSGGNVKVQADGNLSLGALTLTGLTVDTNTLHVDATNNRVGIGTTSPEDPLHVAGDIRTDNASYIVQETSTGGAVRMLGINAGNSAYIGPIDSGPTDAIFNASSTSNTSAFYTAGSEKMRITSAGNVGIGTSSPANGAKLHSAGAIISTDATLGSYNFNNAGFDFVSATKVARFFATSTDTTGGVMTFITGQNLSYAERMRIDSSGNVGIGTSSPANNLDIAAASSATLSVRNTSTVSSILLSNGSSANQVFSRGANSSTGRDLAFVQGTTEAMRIDSSGNLLVGTTSTNPGQNNTDTGTAIYSGGRFMMQNSGSDNIMGRNTDGVLLSIRRSGSEVGSISVTTSATTYNTSSDARLKENIADAEDASSLVDAIKVRQFDWKADGSHQRYGMVAQELLEVAPEAVSGDPESEEMMGVDYSKLVPMLVKEIQSLRARVAQLEGV